MFKFPTEQKLIWFDKTAKSINVLNRFCGSYQGQRCFVAEVWRSGVWAETASRGALVASRGHTLPGLPGPVHLVAAQTSLQVAFQHNARNQKWIQKHNGRCNIDFLYLNYFFCRLCGRIFCYYCSNNFVMTKHSGKKERSCRECYAQHSAVIERFTEAELSPSDLEPPPPGAGPQPPPEPAPYKPTPRVTGERQALLASDFLSLFTVN